MATNDISALKATEGSDYYKYFNFLRTCVVWRTTAKPHQVWIFLNETQNALGLYDKSKWMQIPRSLVNTYCI